MLCFMSLFLFLLSSSPATSVTGRDLSWSFPTRPELAQIAGYGEEKLSTVLITGSLLCGYGGDTAVSGAKVAIACNSSATQMVMWGQEAKYYFAETDTDEYGEYVIDVPSNLHAIPKMEEECRVEVLRVPSNSPCRYLAAMEVLEIPLKLSSVTDSTRVYAAGEVRLRN